MVSFYFILEQIKKYTITNPRLHNIVSSIVFWRRTSEENSCSIFLPNNMCGLGFTLSGELHVKQDKDYEKMPAFGTRNTLNKVSEVKTKGNFFNVSVRLILPNGFCLFTKIPMNRIYEHSAVSLTDIFDKKEVERIAEKLGLAKTDEERVSILESYLVLKITNTCPPLLFHLISNIHQAKGSVNIQALAKQFKVSERTINRYFNQYIGINPNVYINLIRIRFILNSGVGSNSKLSSAAFDAGYYDQSHFIKQFKEFTNFTPVQFLKNNKALSDFYNI